MYDPYLISNLDEYNYFADLINNESMPNQFAGQYFKLVSDIGNKDHPITKIIGMDNFHRFCGLFEGNNKV